MPLVTPQLRVGKAKPKPTDMDLSEKHFKTFSTPMALELESDFFFLTPHDPMTPHDPCGTKIFGAY